MLIGTDASILYAIKTTAYPVGAVYMTVNDDNPAKLFGG